MPTIRIGCGAGFAEDRVEPALRLVEEGKLDYLVFECLAERTITLAQAARLADADAGFNEFLEARFDAVMEEAASRGVRIITNMGGANPLAAAERVAHMAQRKGLGHLKIVVVTGDDVFEQVRGTSLPLWEQPGTVASLNNVISANAYLGIAPILEALRLDADIIITGRVADPSLFLAPLVHEFGWSSDDWERLGAGTAVGHLLECAGHVTGGYFADPGVKDVPGLADLGFPLAEVDEDGSCIITKVPGTGGMVTVGTVTEQLLYEVHDPARYLTPDVVADFSQVTLTQVGPDRVAVRGATGSERPATLKVSVGYADGCIGEGQISYAGPNAVARGRLAIGLIRERIEMLRLDVTDMRYELIGVDAVRRGPLRPDPDIAEVRVRVIGRAPDLEGARRIGHEVAALWLNGPSGGAGATRNARENLAVASTFLPRELVEHTVTLLEGVPA